MTDPATRPDGPGVLLVEDDVLVAMDLAFMLEELGVSVIGPCHTVRDAEARLEGPPPAFAILDYNLREDTSDGIADRLGAMGVPFVFLTGHVARHLPQRFQDCDVVQKPVSQADVRALVRRILPD